MDISVNIPVFGRKSSVYVVKPILHYAFGLRFGNVCKHKRKKNVRKAREKRKWLACLTNA